MRSALSCAAIVLSGCYASEAPLVVKDVYVRDHQLYQERCALPRGKYHQQLYDCVSEPVPVIESQRRLPLVLDQPAISAVLAFEHVEARCGRTDARLDVRVLPAGDVDEVAIVHGADLRVAGCVADGIRRVRFPETRRGGSFTYRPEASE
jgi:hypothetical protein